MNKSKRKITALLIAASMAVGCSSYAVVDGHAKKALAAEININADKKIRQRFHPVRRLTIRIWILFLYP